jgi:hypothetical protein
VVGRIGLAVACVGVIATLCGSIAGAATQLSIQHAPLQVQRTWVWHSTFTFKPRMSLRLPASWKWFEEADSPRLLQFSDPSGGQRVDVLQPHKVFDAKWNPTYLRQRMPPSSS